jgi:diguanylate cyclase (GGDEF)-like protein
MSESNLPMEVRKTDTDGESDLRQNEYHSILNIMQKVSRRELTPEIAAKVIVAQEAQLRVFANEVKDMATIDSLTGAYNRPTIISKIKDHIASQKPENIEPFGILELDVDHFKKVNDTHGHHAGDEVLKDFVAIIFAQLRKPNEIDLVGRYGGEEFLVFLPNISDQKELENVAERIRKAVQDTPSVYGDELINFTTSLGALYVDKIVSFEDIFKLTDKSLYEAKNTGRNKIVVKPFSGNHNV